MYQAIEAISRSGVVEPLEPVQFDESEHLIILRLPANLGRFEWQSIRGAMKGRLSSVDDFIAAKETELVLEAK